MRKIIYFLLPILFMLGSCLDKQKLPTEISEGEIHLPVTKPDNPIISVVMVNPPVADVLIQAVDGPTYVDTINVKEVFVEVPYGGKYEVAVSHEGYYDFYMPIFPLKSNLPLVVTLLKETAPAGLLKIITQLPAFITDMNSGNILMAAPGEIYIAPGDYHLLISRPGYTSVDTIVTVIDNGETVLNINLEKQIDLVGSLTVKVKPELAKITVTDEDGKPQLIRRGSFDQVELPIGAKKIIIEAVGYETQQRSIEIFESEITSLTIELTPIVGEVKYEVILNSEPTGADVYIDGYWATKTTGRIYLTVGKHTLRVQKEGYKPIDTEIDINSDTTYTFDLQPLDVAMGYLTLNPKPINTQTVISGPKQFNAIIIGAVNRYMLAPGEYNLYCSAQGHQDTSITINVVDQQEQVINIVLQHNMIDPDNSSPVIISFNYVFEDGNDYAPATLIANFTATDFDGDSLSYLIEFGDGFFVENKSGSHVYSKSGTYTLTFTVTDGQAIDRRVFVVIIKEPIIPTDTELEIVSVPVGAKIIIDEVMYGVTPYGPEITTLDVGNHNLRLVLDGYEELKTVIKIKSGELNFYSYNLIPEVESYKIRFVSATPDVDVLVDDLYVTKTNSDWLYRSDFGIHKVTYKKDGYFTKDTTYVAANGDEIIMDFVLTEKPKTYIQATANTDSVAVFADRYNYLGMTFLDDPLITEIEPGIHYMEGVKPGWVTDAQDWFANEYETTAIKFNLEKEDNNGGHDTLTTGLRGWIEVDVDDGISNEITSDAKVEIRLPATPVKFEITGKAEGAVSGHLLILNRFGIIDEENFDQDEVKAFYLNNYNFFGTSSQIIIIFTVYDKDGNAFTDCATLLTPRKRVLINWPGFAGEFPFAF